MGEGGPGLEPCVCRAATEARVVISGSSGQWPVSCKGAMCTRVSGFQRP